MPRLRKHTPRMRQHTPRMRQHTPRMRKKASKQQAQSLYFCTSKARKLST
jgi:hypothetical protein